VLTAAFTRFVIPVPSRALRRHLEAERGRRARSPLHPREREDAPPEVLESLWRELVDVAAVLGIVAEERQPPSNEARGCSTSTGGRALADGTGARARLSYDPAVYQAVYERLLVHRHAQALSLDARLPADQLSPYDLRVPASDLVPTEAEASAFVVDVESRVGPEAAKQAIERWYCPS
jgi:hypothetical protein